MDNSSLIWFVIGASCGVAMMVLMQLCFTLWGRTNTKDLQAATKTLKRYGMTPQIYLPGIGITDPVLHDALLVCATHGHVVTNASGEVVGGLYAPQQRKGPHLRLVVSNPDRDTE